MTIDCETPITDKPEDMVCGKPDLEALRELCRELEFNRMMPRVEEYAGAASKGAPQEFKLESPEKKKEKKKKAKKEKGDTPEEPVPVQAVFKIVSDKYRSLLTQEEIEKALAEATKAGLVAVDTETTGLDALTVDIVGVSLAWKEKEAVFIPFNQELKKEKLIKILKPFLENPKIEKGRTEQQIRLGGL